ncbi:MAG TPA: ABC transporter permease subunit [Acidimicrobiales bacterium]|jgi:ABC-2 type transport system permease protein
MIVFERLLRDRRRSTMGWVLGMVAYSVFTVAFYPSLRGQTSFDDVYEDLPEAIKALVGTYGEVSISSAPGYLQARYFGLVPVLLLIFGIGLGARAIGGSEEDGTLELLLSNPVTRRRVALERLAAVIVLVAVVGATGVISLLALAPPVGLFDGLRLINVVAATAAATALALAHAAIAYAVGAVTGRRGTAVAVATVIAVTGYLLQGLATVSDAAQPLRWLSPWFWYLRGNVVINGPGPEAFLLPVALLVMVAAIATVQFERRDLR